MKAESHAASAEEKAITLDRKLAHLSESIEREKKRLHDEHIQLQSDLKLSISRITANVSSYLLSIDKAELAIYNYRQLVT